MKALTIGAGLLLACSAACLQALAQPSGADATLLTGDNVTESNLISSLLPPKDGESEATPGTRGLRPALRKPSSAGAGSTAARPSASLLITFETNSAVLTPGALKQLDVVASALSGTALAGLDFAIEGHADPRGQRDANLTLSQRRAVAVRKYLVESRGLAESRLVAVGKGDSEPINLADISAAENRRVTIVTLSR